MAWETPNTNAWSGTDATSAAEATRVFMTKVYLWMFTGLAVTGATSVVVASNPAWMAAVMGLFVPLLVVEFGIVIAFGFLASRVRGITAAAMFLAYALLNGLVFSLLFAVYELGSIASAFFITAGTFAALSLYGTFTKKDLSSWATFLFMGLVGVILAGVVNLFLRSDALSFVSSCAGVVVFAGLTAYDTQKLRTMHANAGYTDTGALAVSGALTLYLDFINLFLKILRLLGRRR